MQIIFVHQNFPAQFGHIAGHLAQTRGHEPVFVSLKPSGKVGPIRMIQYKLKGQATDKNHFCNRVFEDTIWHTHAVYEALAAHPDLHPDLIVGHSGFGSTLFLRELFDCPIVNYFEYFYFSHNSDLDFRPDYPCRPEDHLRSKIRNAMILLDLNNCDRGYSPTEWQHSRLPAE
jgi:hypothetical protein